MAVKEKGLSFSLVGEGELTQEIVYKKFYDIVIEKIEEDKEDEEKKMN